MEESECPSDYNRIQKIKKGTRGTVYEVEKDGKRFALKEISKDRFQDDQIEVIKKRLEIQKSLEHPNILPVLEILEDCEFLKIVMELCSCDLLNFRKSLKIDPMGSSTRKDIQHIFRQIVETVLYLEDKNLIHNDIKLENVVIHNGIPKLIDFDMIESYVCDEEGKTDLSAYRTYSYYMAPEMCQHGYTTKVNSWQLGMLLYGLLVDEDIPVNILQNYQRNRYADYRQRYEFVAKNAPSIPEELEKEPIACDLVTKLLQPDPNLRLCVKEILEHPYLRV